MSDEIKQFPTDQRDYTPGIDRGWSKYLATSIHNTLQLSLTYDDGPHPSRTEKILDLLKEYDVTATFFVLSSKLNKGNLHIVERILKEGHNLASHDWNHTNNNRESRITFKNDLIKAITKLESIAEKFGIPYREKYFRFPYAAYGNRDDYHHLNVLREISYQLYGENCLNFVFWDIDTIDWVGNMTPNNILQVIKANLFGGMSYKHKKITLPNKKSYYVKKSYTIGSPVGGGVVLMHDIHQRTVKATKLILEYAKQNNINIIPLQEIDEFHFPAELKCLL